MTPNQGPLTGATQPMSEATSYFSEPDTDAKVVLTTTFGDLDIELWGKQCPFAVRNFIQLCLEGFYNGCEFFRIIPGSFVLWRRFVGAHTVR